MAHAHVCQVRPTWAKLTNCKKQEVRGGGSDTGCWETLTDISAAPLPHASVISKRPASLSLSFCFLSGHTKMIIHLTIISCGPHSIMGGSKERMKRKVFDNHNCSNVLSETVSSRSRHYCRVLSGEGVKWNREGREPGNGAGQELWALLLGKSGTWDRIHLKEIPTEGYISWVFPHQLPIIAVGWFGGCWFHHTSGWPAAKSTWGNLGACGECASKWGCLGQKGFLGCRTFRAKTGTVLNMERASHPGANPPENCLQGY